MEKIIKYLVKKFLSKPFNDAFEFAQELSLDHKEQAKKWHGQGNTWHRLYCRTSDALKKINKAIDSNNFDELAQNRINELSKTIQEKDREINSTYEGATRNSEYMEEMQVELNDVKEKYTKLKAAIKILKNGEIKQ